MKKNCSLVFPVSLPANNVDQAPANAFQGTRCVSSVFALFNPGAVRCFKSSEADGCGAAVILLLVGRWHRLEETGSVHKQPIMCNYVCVATSMIINVKILHVHLLHLCNPVPASVQAKHRWWKLLCCVAMPSFVQKYIGFPQKKNWLTHEKTVTPNKLAVSRRQRRWFLSKLTHH